jgi:methionine sulfoxide reductase heme-binding subunit
VSLTSSPVDWYATRAAGIVAYLLLTTVVCLGLVLSAHVRLPRWPRFALEDVHRFVGLLAGTFVGIHVLTIAIDAYQPFSLTALVVPFVSTYRPFWTALGVVALELLVAVAISNRLRARLGHRTWRRLHYLGFGIWLLATFHGLGGGTDATSGWVLLLYLSAISVVAVLACLRAWRIEPPKERAPDAGGRAKLARPRADEQNVYFSKTVGEERQ